MVGELVLRGQVEQPGLFCGCELGESAGKFGVLGERDFRVLA